VSAKRTSSVKTRSRKPPGVNSRFPVIFKRVLAGWKVASENDSRSAKPPLCGGLSQPAGLNARGVVTQPTRLVRWQRNFITLLAADSRMSRSPSARPSPLGRAGFVARRSANRRRFEPSSVAHWDSLSPRERDGVRGNRAHDQERLRMYRNLIVALLLQIWLRRGDSCRQYLPFK